MQHPTAVLQALHVDLDPVPAARVGGADRRQRILGQRRRAAMGVHLHAQAGGAGAGHGQHGGKQRRDQALNSHRRGIHT
ncbi:hypothetical protein G6F57_020683 [Rhizopus arrhizus]|uniref:Uncharacterized protein n=1 Tax=Rhizopus delemar TaxID=936053 RepID=A0A9P7C737_9FUNG|nr:hypothetical protein G6F23_015092 [Rhizopus arrhizus]KAG1238300.1 hypothetical protein G6F68_018767 [Rhizopus microsporus]KAG1242117.1 hypothetical protein G6F65_023176 [Rhizopus arrhizus]KAG1436402.1 hypothetical protein G6F57_020683 [Rhizopus arrhizus]KAG1538878.1 hypothetical protein G6F50_014598 [Rhizopus delemar]